MQALKKKKRKEKKRKKNHHVTAPSWLPSPLLCGSVRLAACIGNMRRKLTWQTELWVSTHLSDRFPGHWVVRKTTPIWKREQE
jgi:hypothetical protein